MVGPMRQEDIWDAEAAERYDTTDSGMFAPEVLGPAVDRLAELAAGGPARELGDHRLGDGGREHRRAAGDDADRLDELLGWRVLEHEAARAGAQGAVDGLVEVERREDHDPRRMP